MKEKKCVSPNCLDCEFSPKPSHRYKLRSLSKKQNSTYEESLGEISALQGEKTVEEILGEISALQGESVGELSGVQKSEEELGVISALQGIEENDNSEETSGGVTEEIPVSKNLGADCYDPRRSLSFGSFF